MRVNLPHADRLLLVFRATLCLVIGAFSAFAQDKSIRLRNQVIPTPPKTGVARQSLAVEAPVNNPTNAKRIDLKELDTDELPKIFAVGGSK